MLSFRPLGAIVVANFLLWICSTSFPFNDCPPLILNQHFSILSIIPNDLFLINYALSLGEVERVYAQYGTNGTLPCLSALHERDKVFRLEWWKEERKLAEVSIFSRLFLNSAFK